MSALSRVHVYYSVRYALECSGRCDDHVVVRLVFVLTPTGRRNDQSLLGAGDRTDVPQHHLRCEFALGADPGGQVLLGVKPRTSEARRQGEAMRADRRPCSREGEEGDTKNHARQDCPSGYPPRPHLRRGRSGSSRVVSLGGWCFALLQLCWWQGIDRYMSGYERLFFHLLWSDQPITSRSKQHPPSLNHRCTLSILAFLLVGDLGDWMVGLGRKAKTSLSLSLLMMGRAHIHRLVQTED